MLCMFQLFLIGHCIFHILRVEKISRKWIYMFCESKFDIYTTFYFYFFYLIVFNEAGCSSDCTVLTVMMTAEFG